MIAAIGRFFQSLLLGTISLFKRALCFLNRKRRNSGSLLPTHIQDTDVDIPTQVLPTNYVPPPSNHDETIPNLMQDEKVTEDEAFADWDSWDTPRLNSDMSQRHLTSTTQYKTKPNTDVEPEPEPDYFSDLGLAPTIKKQPKMFVKQENPMNQGALSSSRSNRLSFQPDAVVPMTTELGEWDDSTGAWDDDDSYLDTDDVVKQSRKAERERRLAEHQRRNQEREAKRLSKENSLLATKLS